MHSLVLADVQGDGNCLYRALSVGLVGNQDSHRELRDFIMDAILDVPVKYWKNLCATKTRQ